MTTKVEHSLGSFLVERRGRLDPTAFGFSNVRRRTKGLRRTEVARLSNISSTWYARLEQDRGGTPSIEVLNQISLVMMLTKPERELLFMLGRGHMPEIQDKAAKGVAPRLQRILDSLEFSPAIIRTATWDIVAWNHAAAVVFTDYGSLPTQDRNILRLIFCKSIDHRLQNDWEGIARIIVNAFRADVAREGAASEAAVFMRELCIVSSEFETLWREDKICIYGETIKRIDHTSLGSIELEYSGFSIDGRPELSMVVLNPTNQKDAERIHSLVTAS